MEAFRECHRQQTPGDFQAVFTHIADKQTRKAFRRSLYVLQSTLTPTLIFPRGFHRGKKKHEFCLWSKHQTADQTTSVHLNS